MHWSYLPLLNCRQFNHEARLLLVQDHNFNFSIQWFQFSQWEKWIKFNMMQYSKVSVFHSLNACSQAFEVAPKWKLEIYPHQIRVNEKLRFLCFYEREIHCNWVTLYIVVLIIWFVLIIILLSMWFFIRIVSTSAIYHYSLSERIEACHFSSLSLSITQDRKNNNGLNGFDFTVNAIQYSM